LREPRTEFTAPTRAKFKQIDNINLRHFPPNERPATNYELQIVRFEQFARGGMKKWYKNGTFLLIFANFCEFPVHFCKFLSISAHFCALPDKNLRVCFENLRV